MTAYDQIFYPIFGVGCAIAATASFLAAFLAARKSGFVFPVVALGVGIIAFWAALFIGSEVGYQTWQSIPDPPAEAFSDTAPMGALIVGWLPGSVYCGVIFGIVFGITWLARHLRPGGAPDLSSDVSDSKCVETGNPYQAPNSSHNG